MRDQTSFRFQMGRGECVGEMSFLSGSANRHSSTAIAVRDTELVKISRASFSLLHQAHPEILIKFVRVMAGRFQRNVARGLSGQLRKPSYHSSSSSRSVGGDAASSKSANHHSAAAAGARAHHGHAGGAADFALGVPENQQCECMTVALFPTSPSVPVQDFASALSVGLSFHGSTLVLSPATVDQLLGHNTCASLSQFYHRNRLTCWLAEQEEANRFIVFLLQPEDSPWTQVCLRSADLVMVVADGSATASVSELERTLLWNRHDPGKTQATSFCRKELVLLHPPATVVPTGTRKWFSGRVLDTYHHVKQGHQPHYDRIARILAGKAVGVVMSGGGSRGLAHLGLVRAMHEQNIPIDFIGGTSQGSFMACLYALRPVDCAEDLAAMASKTSDMASKLGSLWELLSDATFPVMSYFEGRKFGENIKAIIGEDVQIEDLWVKFFCITTNITKADESVHRLGTAWKAVRASMSILDYLPPMQIDRDLHIDGGYINNLPCDVMKEQYQARFVVAMDIENKDEDHLKNNTVYGDCLSGWTLLGNKLWTLVNPFATRLNIPRYAAIVGSLNYINHNRNVRQLITSGMIDLYLCPDLGNTQLLDYHKMGEIVTIGYQTARLQVQDFRAQHGADLPAAPHTIAWPMRKIPIGRSSDLEMLDSSSRADAQREGVTRARTRAPANKVSSSSAPNSRAQSPTHLGETA
eukprot:CAMPEP_0175145320 /NCGR_PEP_ID=MMETSP0087-20121206/14689_1 /TAXON_ID=136419 /ORGANISM="Unknown Unknown, Strain D1" /LENGTH=696 /DNA_ID=CAMNT_0016430021 /DNA_START=46 /DNA_END=2136 /DNA_ORIENTATION=+